MSTKLKKIIKIILIIIFAPLLLVLIDSIIGDPNSSAPPKPEIEEVEVVEEEEDRTTEAFVYCQQTVEANLKAPTTAEHPYKSDISLVYNKPYYIINGYVDSQNSYGAMLRINYYCKLKYDNGIFSAEEFYFK